MRGQSPLATCGTTLSLMGAAANADPVDPDCSPERVAKGAVKNQVQSGRFQILWRSK